ncbi:MAG: NADH-quinone oxidoreductase subunit N [Methylotenera sp.]|nr:NADH-quinone oxidoreductase subunit N [Oligoflexia bacterium]
MEALTIIRPESLSLSSEQVRALMPYFLVFGGIMLATLLAVVKGIKPKWPVFLLAVATAVVGVVASANLIPDATIGMFNGMMVSDSYSHFFNVIFMASAGITILASLRYLDREQLQHPEYYVLVLLSALGMMLMTSALDLIVIFIALEIMSLAVYVLVGFRRTDKKSNEAAMKYFILGSAASAILLYGAALLYGATQSTNIHEILKFTQAQPAGMTPLFTLGVWLVMIGFLFKVASVPFHMWMPDVYEGAPAPVTGFMTTGLKAAAFASFMRFFISMGYGTTLSATLQAHIHDILWVSAVLTMIVGNVIALTQTNLKRMLAYSSIAHSGYLLVGLLAGSGTPGGYSAVVFYLVAYAIMNLGAFIILTVISNREDTGLNLHDVSGLASRSPWLSFAMAVFLFSMAGIPPTAGFAAKYMLFYSAIQAHETPLVIISVLCSSISVYYYLRVLVYMYMREPVGSAPASRVSMWSALAVALMVAMTLQFGVVPARLVEVTKRAVASL